MRGWTAGLRCLEHTKLHDSTIFVRGKYDNGPELSKRTPAWTYQNWKKHQIESFACTPTQVARWARILPLIASTSLQCCKQVKPLKILGMDCKPNELLPRLRLPGKSEKLKINIATPLVAVKLHKKQRFLSDIVQPFNNYFSLNNPIKGKPLCPSTERGPSARWLARVGKREACRPMISGNIDGGLTWSDLAIPSLLIRVSRSRLSFDSKLLMWNKQSLTYPRLCCLQQDCFCCKIHVWFEK